MDRSKNEPGTLGADKLSTGANVSRTMDSLNATDTPVSGGAAFSKHNFDKIDPSTGDIILTPSTKPKKSGLFGGLFGSSPRGRAAKTAQPTQPESTSIVENRSASVNIPAEFQNPTETKKPFNKKFLAIVLIVILVIAGVGVGVWVVMSNTGRNSSGGQTGNMPGYATKYNFDDSLNRFMNYLIYGTQSMDDPIVPDRNTVLYAAQEALELENVDYLDNLRELFLDFYNNVKKDSSTSDSLDSYVTSYYDTINFVTTVASIKDDVPDMITLYKDNGLASAETEVESMFEPLGKIDSYKSREYIKSRLEYDKLQLQMIKTYDDYGCISDTLAIDKTCAFTPTDEIVQQMSNLRNRSIAIKQDAYNEIVPYAIEIYNEVKTPIVLNLESEGEE